MQERRLAKSTFDDGWSTAVAHLPVHLHIPRHRATGISRRAETVFNVVSGFVILIFALGWSWSIAMSARPTGIIAAALSDSRAPSIAYLTDAALELVNPLRGESGRLRASIRQPGETVSADTLPAGATAKFSSGAAAESSSVLAAPRRAGIWSVAISIGNALKPIGDFSVITLRPAADKRSGRIGLYYIGNWPSARPNARVNYTPPSGFIEATPQNENTPLSDHFKLRDFFPHDQQNVWPKYIVVDLKLIDKLELVLADLSEHGIRTDGVRVMSGFRTPQYNRGGGDPRGRAALSRHMYGDAADIFIDNDGNGSMDDLNHDGRVNISDARVILAAVNRVEAAHPSLIGGCGVYAGTPAHGPFTHIDTRGYAARWIGTGDN
ncbi:MAG TPA: D-Ala-D-Ala carboxypeptidase family metallohydrolase [Gemmatimonadaceae bacterium]